MSGYLAALALTLAIELPVYGWFLSARAGVRPATAVLVGAAATAITHPLAFGVLFDPFAEAAGTVPALLAVELGVWAAETLVVFAWLRRDPLVCAATAFVANALSLGVGLLVLS